jgi:hypothetical protein
MATNCDQMSGRSMGTTADRPDAAEYQIRVRGHLDARWSAWFDGLAIVHEPDGDTTLAGPVADQAALYGLLSRLRDLNLTLLAVTRRPSPRPRTQADAGASPDDLARSPVSSATAETDRPAGGARCSAT